MRRQRFLSTYTGMIIAANVLFFIGALVLMNSIGELKAFSFIALMPAAVLTGHNLWTFITSMFMHANFTHLFVNMISLMFIGCFVEKLVGKKRFVGLYFAGGLFAGVLFVLISLIFKPDNFICPAVITSIKGVPSYCIYAVGLVVRFLRLVVCWQF